LGGIGNKCAQTIHLCKILCAFFNIQNSKSGLLLNIDLSSSTSSPSLQFPLCPRCAIYFRPICCLVAVETTLVICPDFLFPVRPEAAWFGNIELAYTDWHLWRTSTCELRLLTVILVFWKKRGTTGLPAEYPLILPSGVA
jgi:hypothetical protein